VESLRSIFLDKIDRIPSFEIRYSLFDILRFAVRSRGISYDALLA
jgi:hypothetical protein